jgi:hypothetical protein
MENNDGNAMIIFLNGEAGAIEVPHKNPGLLINELLRKMADYEEARKGSSVIDIKEML